VTEQRVGINKRIADRLLKEGRIDETDYTRVIDYCKRKSVRVEEALIELDLMDEQTLLKYIATVHKTQFVSTERMSKARIDRDALKLVPKGMARHFSVYPLVLDRVNDKLIIATADPDNPQAIDELRVSSGVNRVVAMVARPEAVFAAIERGYEGDRTRFAKLMQPRAGDLADMIFNDPGGRHGAQKPAGQTVNPAAANPAPAAADWSKAMPPAEQGRRERGTSRPQTGEFDPPRRKTGETEMPLAQPPPRQRTGRRPEPPEGRYGHGQGPHDAWYDEYEREYERAYDDNYRDPRRGPPPRDYPPPQGRVGRQTDARSAPEGYGRPGPPGPRGYPDAPPPHPSSSPGRPRSQTGRAHPTERAQRSTDAYYEEPSYDAFPPAYEHEPNAYPDNYEEGYTQRYGTGQARGYPPPPAQLEAPRGPLPHKSSMFPRPIGIGFGPVSTRAQGDVQANEIFGTTQVLELLRVLVGLLENDREELRGHSAFVARLAHNMCERIALPKEQANAIVVASYLHDLGKMGQHHLTALNVAQFDNHLQAATKLSKLPQQLMESVGLPETTVKTMGAMYERMGGSGIPEGLAGKDIPIGARILAIADSYADLTRNARNVYSSIMTADEALVVLKKHAPSVFDANLIGVLEKATSGEKILTDLLANRHRVLIVDPDPEETMVLQLRLVEQGFDVHVARNIEEARIALAAREFAMVVSEVHVGAENAGLSLHREFKPQHPNMSWVFLSAQSSREMAERVFKLGVDDFIAKPVSTEILVAKLTQLCDKQSQKMAPRGVSGSLSQMSLSDIIQILWHGRKTCALKIKQGESRGEIHFAGGMLVNAKWGGAEGEVAFYRMLTLGENGEFSVDPSFVPQGEPAIHASPEALLLEGMRLLDEGKIP
jgi:response regulator RpfG family c-di-GMP phosphodiesterase